MSRVELSALFNFSFLMGREERSFYRPPHFENSAVQRLIGDLQLPCPHRQIVLFSLPDEKAGASLARSEIRIAQRETTIKTGLESLGRDARSLRSLCEGHFLPLEDYDAVLPGMP